MLVHSDYHCFQTTPSLANEVTQPCVGVIYFSLCSLFWCLPRLHILIGSNVQPRVFGHSLRIQEFFMCGSQGMLLDKSICMGHGHVPSRIQEGQQAVVRSRIPLRSESSQMSVVLYFILGAYQNCKEVWFVQFLEKKLVKIKMVGLYLNHNQMNLLVMEKLNQTKLI